LSHLHFVAVDDTGRPVEVPQIIPETELEQERFDAALRQATQFSFSWKNETRRSYRIESVVHVKKER
jgi:hypothetical protein